MTTCATTYGRFNESVNHALNERDTKITRGKFCWPTVFSVVILLRIFTFFCINHCVCCLIDSGGCCSGKVCQLWCSRDIKCYKCITFIRAFVSVTLSDRSLGQAAGFQPEYNAPPHPWK